MSLYTTLAIAIAAGIAFGLRKKKRKDSPPRSGWRIRFSPGMPSSPARTAGGWRFDFPTDPAKHVHYVQNFTVPANLATGRELYARFRITGAGFIAQEFPDRAATVTMLIQRKGDNWSGQGDFEGFRWFSRAMQPLMDGKFELVAPLDAQSFGGVNGGHDPVLFTQALIHAESIGLVFGSAGGRGHGVYATSPASFELLSMGVRG